MIQLELIGGSAVTWVDSYTKLLAVNQTQYDRVLSLDSDSAVLQTMDELFLIPPSPVAMPRAYWLGQPFLSSQLVLIQPSHMEYQRVANAIENSTSDEYDMEIFNNLYGRSGFVLPHRPYNLLTGEFRSTSHGNYMGNSEEVWDPEVQLNEAKFLHFSDYPVPKPWLPREPSVMEEYQPKCEQDPVTGNVTDCRAQNMWLGFYNDFAERRKVHPISLFLPNFLILMQY
jgi:alpha-N-acetylglucosamine transferase